MAQINHGRVSASSASLMFLIVTLAACTAAAPSASPTGTPAQSTAAPPTISVRPTPSQFASTQPPATASPAPLKGTILFGRHVNGATNGYFTISADGQDEHRLADDTAGCLMCPRYSFDGRRILVAALSPDGRVSTATMNRDGSDYTILPLPDATINLAPGEWSPNGELIAFDGWDDSDDSRRGVYIGSSTGGGALTRVTEEESGEVPLGFYSHSMLSCRRWDTHIENDGRPSFTPAPDRHGDLPVHRCRGLD
jgi:hypothetical protein